MLNLRKGGLEPLFMVNGNLSQKISKITGEKTLHSWDEENRKVQTVVKNPDDSIKRTISYKYDGLERRIQKNVNGVATNFVYDSEDIILEFGENNSIKAMYLHGPGVDEPFAMVRDVNGDGNFSSNELFFYLKDHLGSVHVLTDKDGVPVQRYNYSAYGRTKVEKVSANVKLVKSAYGYTSREWEEETGDYYYRARWYDPGTGRFLSEDPIGFKSGENNFYRYASNNPLLFNDAFGLYTCSESNGGVTGNKGTQMLINSFLRQHSQSVNMAWNQAVNDRLNGMYLGSDEAASAEHYLYSRSEVSSGSTPPLIMSALVPGYQAYKAISQTYGGASSATPPSQSQLEWGWKGIIDGL